MNSRKRRSRTKERVKASADRANQQDHPTAEEQAGQASGRPLSNTARLINLIIGDALVFIIFSITGRSTHGEEAGLSAFFEVLLTAAPFAVAWFLVAPFVGVYRQGLDGQPKQMLLRTLLAWLAAWPVGLLFRGILTNRIPHWSFALVTLGVVAILLVIWRWPYSLMHQLRQKQQ